MMESTVSAGTVTRTGANVRPPKDTPVRRLAKKLGISEKAAEHRMERTHDLLPLIIAAFGDDTAACDKFFATSDAIRQQGVQEWEASLLRSKVAADSAEDLAREDWNNSDKGPEAKRRYLSALRMEHATSAEVIASMEATL